MSILVTDMAKIRYVIPLRVFIPQDFINNVVIGRLYSVIYGGVSNKREISYIIWVSLIYVVSNKREISYIIWVSLIYGVSNKREISYIIWVSLIYGVSNIWRGEDLTKVY